MATWTQLQNLGTFSNDGNNADYDDNDNIYLIKIVGGEAHVHRYVVSTDTLTQISNSASFGSGPNIDGSRPFGPIYFNGSVFVIVGVLNGYKVFKYDGSGTAWTEVLSVATTATSGGFASIGKTDDHIVLLVNNTQPNPLDVDYIVKYSVNGTAWSDGTVDAGPSLPAATWQSAGSTILNSNGTVTGLYAYDQIDDAATPNHFVKRILEWDGTSGFTTAFYYTYDNPTHTGDSWVEDYLFNDVVHWSVPSSDYEFSATLDGTFATTTPADVSPALTNGFTTSAGSDDNIDGDLALHYMPTDTGVWDAGEAIDPGATLGFVKRVIRFTTSGDTYLIISGGVSQPTYIYGRDEPLDPPETATEYWHGVGGPGTVKDSDLPFKLATPDALAVSAGGIAAVGASTAETEMILASSDYINWAAPAGAEGHRLATQVTSLRWLLGCGVNYGSPDGSIQIGTNTGETITLPPGNDGEALVSGGDGQPPTWGQAGAGVLELQVFS